MTCTFFHGSPFLKFNSFVFERNSSEIEEHSAHFTSGGSVKVGEFVRRHRYWCNVILVFTHLKREKNNYSRHLLYPVDIFAVWISQNSSLQPIPKTGWKRTYITTAAILPFFWQMKRTKFLTTNYCLMAAAKTYINWNISRCSTHQKFLPVNDSLPVGVTPLKTTALIHLLYMLTRLYTKSIQERLYSLPFRCMYRFKISNCSTYRSFTFFALCGFRSYWVRWTINAVTMLMESFL